MKKSEILEQEIDFLYEVKEKMERDWLTAKKMGYDVSCLSKSIDEIKASIKAKLKEGMTLHLQGL